MMLIPWLIHEWFEMVWWTESIRRLIELGNQLSKGLANILDHQSYMRQREELHSDCEYL